MHEQQQQISRLIRSGKSAEAIFILDEIIQNSEPLFWAYKERGFAKKFTDDIAGAIEDFSMIVLHWPDEPQGYTLRAEVRRLQCDLPGSVQDLSVAIRINPQHNYVYLSRGRIKVQLGDLVGAIDDFTAAIDHSDTGALSGLLNRGEAKHRLGDHAGAIVDLTEAMDLEVSPPIHAPLFRARVKASMKDYAGAITDYTTALAGYPELTNALRERACMKSASGDAEGAAADLKEYERLGGKDLPAYQSN